MSGYATPKDSQNQMILTELRENARLARLFDFDSALIVSYMIPIMESFDDSFRNKCKYILEGLGSGGPEGEPEFRLHSLLSELATDKSKTLCSIPIMNFVDMLYLVLSSKDTHQLPIEKGEAIKFRQQQKVASSTFQNLITDKRLKVSERYLDDVMSAAGAYAPAATLPTTPSTPPVLFSPYESVTPRTGAATLTFMSSIPSKNRRAQNNTQQPLPRVPKTTKGQAGKPSIHAYRKKAEKTIFATPTASGTASSKATAAYTITGLASTGANGISTLLAPQGLSMRDFYAWLIRLYNILHM